MSDTCEKCKDCYEVTAVGYFRHYCKYFKCWLLPDKERLPLKTATCKELGEVNE